MEAFKFQEYLDFYPRKYDRWNSEYDGVKDFTFDLWLTLKNGASLKEAIRVLAEEKKLYSRSAICVSDDAVNALGEEKDSLFKLCEEKEITLLRDDAGTYYNYHDGREYCIHTQEGYGMVDDAATYLCIWWNKIPTPEEAEAKKIQDAHFERQRTLRDGKEACEKYCLQNTEHVVQVENRLKTMLDELNVKSQMFGKSETADKSFGEAMRINSKMKTLNYYQKMMACAREYLLAPEELE